MRLSFVCVRARVRAPILMKHGINVMPLEVTLTSYILISFNQ